MDKFQIIIRQEFADGSEPAETVHTTYAQNAEANIMYSTALCAMGNLGMEWNEMKHPDLKGRRKEK